MFKCSKYLGALRALSLQAQKPRHALPVLSAAQLTLRHPVLPQPTPAGERHDTDGPPPGFERPANGFAPGFAPGYGPGSRDPGDGGGYDRALPPSSNPYAIPAPAATPGAQRSKHAAPAAAAAANGYGGGAPPSQPGLSQPGLSQPGFATQMPTQLAFTQAFAGLSQDSFAPPSELELDKPRQSQQGGGLSQYDSYFQQ